MVYFIYNKFKKVGNHMKKDNLGERMKMYENVSSPKLMTRVPIIIRLDGNSFHTYTKGMNRPFDETLADAMQQTMLFLCENVPDCRLGYTQSDEITLVLTNDITLEHDAWFKNKLAKLISITASMASFKFNDVMYAKVGKPAFFDSRAFTVPTAMEVANNLHWRQADAERNSVQMVAQSQYKQSELTGISNKDLQNKLLTEKDINWNNFPVHNKRGICAVKGDSGWYVDENTPIFKKEWSYILDRI